MKVSHFALTAAIAAFINGPQAFAHLTYGGRDFGTLVEGASATTIATQTLSSSFGWADATDSDWGDSHRGRFFRFTLTSTTSVSITAQRNLLGTGANGVLLPGISLFSGLGTISPEAAGHDTSALSLASRPGTTEGSFRSTANWSLGNDPTYNTPGDPLSGILYAARLANFTFVGYAVDGTSANFGAEPGIVGDGVADGYVNGYFADLPAGDYSFFVGGANYDAQLSEVPTYPTYGVTVSVQAIPEPGTYALGMGAATLGAMLVRRRRNRR
ncbi:MAG: hypothetical protein RIQ79_1633 [Verrucomicrobiota bacterium]